MRFEIECFCPPDEKELCPLKFKSALNEKKYAPPKKSANDEKNPGHLAISLKNKTNSVRSKKAKESKNMLGGGSNNAAGACF